MKAIIYYLLRLELYRWCMIIMTVALIALAVVAGYFMIFGERHCAETDTMIRTFHHWSYGKGGPAASYTYQCIPRSGN